MAIIQISKIQQRSGNLVDLPQLDEAQFGWANDERRLFIGTTTPNPIENVEVLTSYSNISFSQLNGAYGNLNINIANSNVAANSIGEVLAFDGTNWINAGGNAGGEINLGNVSNVTITGGAIGYVLETDGLGNLSWTPKGTLYTNIIGLSNDNPIVMTVANTVPYTNKQAITISGANGVSNSIVNGQTLYVKLANNYPTSGNVTLYSDLGLTTPVDGAGLTYTNSPNAIATSVISSGGGVGTPGGSTSTIQFNDSGTFGGNAGFTFNNSTGAVVLTGNITAGNVYANSGTIGAANLTGTLTTAAQPNITSTGTLATLSVSGNATVGNLNTAGTVTATRLISNIATGTAPLTVTSTTQVANLNVATSGTAGTVTTAAQPNITSVGTLTSISVSGNANIGNIGTAGLITATGNITGGNLVTGGLVSVTGNILAGNVYANSGIVKGQYLYGDGSNITNLNISAGSSIVNGTSNVSVPSSGGNVNTVVAGNTTLVVTGTGANITGTISVSGNANVGNLGTAGLITATGNVTGGNVITSKYLINSIQTGISAAGSTQGTGTALANTVNIVSTVSSGNGVVLPTAIAGMTIYITNTSANSLLVYPASGATINELATNAGYTQATKATIHYVAASSTQWYSVGATYA